MQAAPVTLNNQYSSKIANCCDIAHRLANDVHLFSCIDASLSGQIDRDSRTLNEKINGVANRLDELARELSDMLDMEGVS